MPSHPRPVLHCAIKPLHSSAIYISLLHFHLLKSQQIIPGALNKIQTLYWDPRGSTMQLRPTSPKRLGRLVCLNARNAKTLPLCFSNSQLVGNPSCTPSPSRMKGRCVWNFPSATTSHITTKKGDIRPWRVFEASLPVPAHPKLSGVRTPGGRLTWLRCSHSACMSPVL